jgi:hypothetical protein
MKFPYDGSFISPEMGALGIPSFDLTEADKKRALWQALMQGGIGMAAASLGGANTSQALGKGLLGGADAYGQALSAPLQRMELFGKQLKLQGDQLSNAKNLGELNDRKNMQGLLGSVAKISASPFSVQGSQEMGIGPLNPDLPEMQAATKGAQLDQFNNPAFLTQLLATGMKGGDLKSAQDALRPYQQDPGKFYNGQYLPDPTKGVGMVNGEVTALPGFEQTQNKINYAGKAGELAAQLAYDRAKLPYDVSRAGQVAAAETAAKDPYQFQQIQGPNGQPVFMTNPQARNQAQGNQFPGYRVPPDVQAQRDNVAREIYSNEGRPSQFSPRLNDNPGAGLAPQVAGVQGQSPADKVQSEEIAKGQAKVYEDLRAKATDHSSMLNKYKQVNALLGDFEGGKLSPLMTDIASAANSLGMKIDDKLPNKEAARSLQAMMMGDYKSLLSGPTSDSDRKVLLSIPPSEANTAAGRKRIQMVMEKLSERSAQEFDMANKWVAKYGKITPEFERQLNHWRRTTNMFTQ